MNNGCDVGDHAGFQNGELNTPDPTDCLGALRF
jgi:hypothetical protein